MPATQAHRKETSSMRRPLRTLAAVVALSLLAVTGGGTPTTSAQGNKVIIKFSHNQQTITPPHKAAEMFKQLVEQRSNGYYDVQIFPAQQLGGLRDQVEQTILGAIEVTQQPIRSVEDFKGMKIRVIPS